MQRIFIQKNLLLRNQKNCFNWGNKRNYSDQKAGEPISNPPIPAAEPPKTTEFPSKSPYSLFGKTLEDWGTWSDKDGWKWNGTMMFWEVSKLQFIYFITLP